MANKAIPKKGQCQKVRSHVNKDTKAQKWQAEDENLSSDESQECPQKKKEQKNKVVSVESNSSNGEDSPEIIQEDLGTEGAIH